MKVNYFFATLLLLSSLIFSQTGTYEFHISEYSNKFGMEALENGSMITLGNGIAEVTEDGSFNSITSEGYGGASFKGAKQILDCDGGYVLLNSKLTKYDLQHNEVWSSQGIEFQYNLRVIKDSQGNFYVLSSADNLHITKFNSSGVTEWQKSVMEASSLGLRNRFLTVTSDDKLVCGNQTDVIWLDTDGNKLDSAKINANDAIALPDNKVLFLGDNYVYSSTGDSLYEITANSFDSAYPKSTIALNNKIYHVNGYQNLNVYDMEGNFVERFNTILNYDKMEYRDGYFYLSGTEGSYLNCLKMDTLGNYSALWFSELADGDELKIGAKVAVKYQTNLSDKYFSFYTSEDGSNWELQKDNISGSESEFEWIAPSSTMDSLFLKLEQSDNTDLVKVVKVSLKSFYSYDYFGANNIKMYVNTNGSGSHNSDTDGSGLYWPENSQNTLTFADGALIGYKKEDTVKVQGSTFNFGLTAGYLDENGNPNMSSDERNQVFKLVRNWEQLPDGEEKAKYQYHHEHWPAELGAPFVDTDNDGVYNYEVDYPDYPGDEILFWTSHCANDLASASLYGVTGDKIEVHTTVYDLAMDEFDDVVFKKYKYINKTGKTLNNTILSYWADDDLGNANDDFVGSLEEFDMAYSYNADNYDEDYYSADPPAIGRMFLEGPAIEGTELDTAWINGNPVAGKKNLPITAFAFYTNGSSVYVDPDLQNADGAVQMYHYMNGYMGSGSEFIDPTTNEATKLCLDGDPVAGNGWYEGAGWTGGLAAGDRRYTMSSGPFEFADGDTVQVTYAFLVARGNSNLNSVEKLRSLASKIKTYHKYGVLLDVEDNKSDLAVDSYSLNQNYPNPFNPSTTISFTIPQKEIVKISIYNLLGEKVSELVNSEFSAGIHNVKFNASKLASGIYFYNIKAGEFTQTRKMMLLK